MQWQPGIAIELRHRLPQSLTCHPKSTTHSGMSPAELAESGVTDGLVRISVGIEDWRDLLADFDQALAAVG